jgi:AraC family transcriptional regulator
MRTEYSWIPAGESAGRTEPNQVGVSFTQHAAAVFESDGRTVRSNIAAGSVFVTGDEPITWHQVEETSEALEIFPEPALLPPGLRPSSATRDGTVLAIATVLRRVHAAGLDLSDIEASTLAHRLAGHLLERHSPAKAVLPRQGKLDHATVDRVAQFVDAELSGELTIEALAAVATLSPFHFARAFKASTGLAPHQFVTARRVDRAKTLLLGSDASVVDVAHAVGLSNVSHFRRVFRGHLGVLPGAIRDSKIRPSQRAHGVSSSRRETQSIPVHQR